MSGKKNVTKCEKRISRGPHFWIQFLPGINKNARLPGTDERFVLKKWDKKERLYKFQINKGLLDQKERQHYRKTPAMCSAMMRPNWNSKQNLLFDMLETTTTLDFFIK